MKPSEKRALRMEQVAEYRQSGLSAEQWCQENELNLYTLRYWISKLNRETREPQEESCQWVSLSTESPSLKVTIGNATITLQEGFDPELLRQIIQVLKATC